MLTFAIFSAIALFATEKVIDVFLKASAALWKFRCNLVTTKSLSRLIYFLEIISLN